MEQHLFGAAAMVHMGGLLQVGGYPSRDQPLLPTRLFAGICFYVAYYVFCAATPPWEAILWTGVLMSTNFYVMARPYMDRRHRVLTPDEQRLVSAFSARARPVPAPDEGGKWVTAGGNTKLTLEGKRPDALFFVLDDTIVRPTCASPSMACSTATLPASSASRGASDLPNVPRARINRAGRHRGDWKLRAAAAIVLFSALGAASAGAQEAGDPRRGELLFRNHCGICHAIDLPHTVFGPHLVGVFGREAGSVPNYRYTYEMGISGIVWDEESLDALMTDPQALVPGTNMYFRGLPNASDRAHIIAYLKQQSQSD